MTRVVLSFLVCALCVVVGLATGHVQTSNHARATALDAIKRECDLLEAQIEDLEAETLRQRYTLRWSFEHIPADI